MQTFRNKDYFSFESIRDKNNEVVCYHVTVIGTIEKDGETRIRSGIGTTGDKRMAFGKITVYNNDRKINVLLRETNSRCYYHSTTIDGEPYNIISFAANEKHAEEIYNFNVGDRVLIEGRAYIRAVPEGQEGRLPELSITVVSSFVLGRRRRAQMDLVPQEVIDEGVTYVNPLVPHSIDDDETPMGDIQPQEGLENFNEE